MDEDSRTIWCGNLSNKCTEDILYELFLQAGPLEKVNIPKDRDGSQKSFGFVTFKHMVSVPYALDLFEGTSLFNRALMLKNRQVNDSKTMANKFNNEVLQYGNQSLENSMMYNISRNMLPMFVPPGAGMYPSQMNNFPSPKDDNRRARNHPYSRDRERERERERDRDRQDRSHRNQHHKNDHRNQRHYHNRSRNTR